MCQAPESHVSNRFRFDGSTKSLLGIPLSGTAQVQCVLQHICHKPQTMHRAEWKECKVHLGIASIGASKPLVLYCRGFRVELLLAAAKAPYNIPQICHPHKIG